MLRRTFLAAAALPALGQSAPRRFVRRFYHDKDQFTSAFADFAMLTRQRGLALGVQAKLPDGRPTGIMISTSDGGATWQEAPLKFLPVSLFALENSSLWAVSDKQEIWFSAEGGREWRKLSRAKNALRVHFLNDQIGFAVGARKTALRTKDGGKTWKPIPEAEKSAGNPETAAFTWVTTAGGRLVSIFGNTQAFRRRRASRYLPPDWMDPNVARLDMESPSITLALDSKDAGESFKPATVNAFGNLHRVRVAPDGQGLILLKFERYFPYGGELYRFRADASTPIERVYRPENQTLQDMVWIPGEGAFVAVTARPNKVQLPVPGPVKVMHSRDLQTWTEIPVDYRAEANAVILSEVLGQLWMATDDGMILQLV